MRRRAFINGVLPALLWDGALAAEPLPALQETPMFADRVKAGALPPVARRIPEQPLVVRTFAGDDGPGRHGGQLTTLMPGVPDLMLMMVYSYTRLIVYDSKFERRPDILESYDVREGRAFTFRLRAGHKWSDGTPFTTEDFRFFWQDVANNKELSPSGPPAELLVDGKLPRVEIIDERTIQYSWDKPNPYFIESLARPAPLVLFAPAHYLKKFHPRYTDAAGIASAAKAGQQGASWVQIFRRVDTMYTSENVELPTLNPWMPSTPPPAQRYVFVRNPYYHRIDEKGQQLPYADRFILAVAAPNVIPAKAGMGEADLQARYVAMRDYAFLQNSAKSSGIQVWLWEFGWGSRLALYPNLNANDEEWRKLLRDVRLRRALSMAIDRDEINQVVCLGLGTPSNNTIIRRSELFKPEYASKWANYDPAAANKLLDEIGLTRRDANAIRLLPDGRPALIVVESQSEGTEDADILQLIAQDWKKIGIRMLVRQQTRENLRLRNSAGETLMTVFVGQVTAMPSPDTSPWEYAPTRQGRLQWPKWGMYFESKGTQGEKCDMPEACKLLDYVKEWEHATDTAGRRKAWEKILQTNADEVFSIGTVNGVRQPLVVSAKIRNVPKEGYYAWDPSGFFGLYQPATFWVAP